MRLLNAITFFGILILSSCAHHMRGTVAMKVNDREAHVCLDKDEVQVGDRLVAYYNNCKYAEEKYRDSLSTPCVKTKLGGATVKRILNDHYSLVEFDVGVKFSEGSFLEKM